MKQAPSSPQIVTYYLPPELAPTGLFRLPVAEGTSVKNATVTHFETGFVTPAQAHRWATAQVLMAVARNKYRSPSSVQLLTRQHG